MMFLCIGILEQVLNRKVIYKNYHNSDNPFVLERCEIFCENSVLNTGVLYLARAEELPEKIIFQDGTALICLGIPTDTYTKSLLHLFAIEDNISLIRLSNEVNNIFFEYNNLERKLQDAVNNSRDIQYMIDLMTPYLNGNELIAMNSDFRIVGKSNDVIHMSELSELSQSDDNELPSEIVDFFKNDIIYSKIKNIREPFFYEPSIFVGRILCTNVFYKDEFACRIGITEDQSHFIGYEKGLISFFTKFVQLTYDLVGDKSNLVPHDHMVKVYISLLKGETIKSWQIENSILQRKWHINGSFLCGFILPNDRDYYNHTIPYYCRILNREVNGCCAFEYNQGIVCVVDLTFYKNSADCFFKKNSESFRDRYFRAGYSNTFKNLNKLKSFFKQAEIALKTGLKKNPSIWYYRFSDIVLDYMKYKLIEEIDASYICAPEVLTLHKYDKAHGGEYLRTLTTYLNNQMNAVKTANDLYIHRATMIKRLDRIKMLTGIDFKNPETIMYLMISVKLFSPDDD